MLDRPCTRSEERQLRKQLSTRGFVDDSLQPVWMRVLVRYQEEVGQVEALCRELDGVEALTSRVKTIPTLVEKLKRFPTQQLLNVDDLAGCRIIIPDVLVQDRLVMELLDRLPESGYEAKALKDRRWSDGKDQPSEGYRAVHVIARKDWFRCEIQVRTSLQQQWAEIFESVCDRWGRGPRYGKPVDEGHLPASGETAMTRHQVIELLKEASRAGEDVERAMQLLPGDGAVQQRLDGARHQLQAMLAQLAAELGQERMDT